MWYVTAPCVPPHSPVEFEVPAIRKGLNSRKLSKKIEMLDLIRLMAELPGIGQLLLPFYRTLLPPLSKGGTK